MKCVVNGVCADLCRLLVCTYADMNTNGCEKVFPELYYVQKYVCSMCMGV